MFETTSVTPAAESKSQSMSQATEARKVDAPVKGEKAKEQPTEEKSSQVPVEKLETSVDELNTALKSLNVKREFSLSDETNEVVVKIIDSEDKSVIRQIPNEEAVKLSQNIKEMVGLLYDSTS